jgi:hypothetical protein
MVSGRWSEIRDRPITDHWSEIELNLYPVEREVDDERRGDRVEQPVDGAGAAGEDEHRDHGAL